MNKYNFFIIVLVFSMISSCNSDRNNKSNEKKLHTIDWSYMDTTVRPQDDFYEYANGNWAKNHPVPSTESKVGSFYELSEKNKLKLGEILEQAASSNDTLHSVNQLIGDYYVSFLDTASRNELGVQPIQADLDYINNLDIKSDFGKLMGEFKLKGYGNPLGFYVMQDLKQVDLNAAYFFQSGLSLPNKNYYTDENKISIREEFLKFVSKIHQLAGDDKIKADEKAQTILKLETSLAQFSMSPVEQRDFSKQYNKRSIVELSSLCEVIKWDDYFNTINVNIDTVIVGQLDFVAYLNTFINNTSDEELKTYFKWNVLNSTAGVLDDKMAAANFHFYSTILKGVKEMKPLNERAISSISNSALGEALGRAFVDKHFTISDKNRINEMVDNIMSAFQDRLKTLVWMSEPTKLKALEKLNSFGRKLGYPDKWTNYSTLTINKNDYFGNYFASVAFSTQENLDKIGKPVDKTAWEMAPHIVNAYYTPFNNEIVFPAGIMQPPFYDSKAEDAINYGRIGMVIGHEFSHGFDDQGANFDATGSMNSWWSSEDKEKFDGKTGRLASSFETFCPYDGVCVNGNLTLGENIADLGGLTFAYYAYLKTDEAKSGKKINGFTPEQRFFLSAAQIWKINYTEAAMKQQIATNPHAPGNYRVNGPFRNMPEFFKAFDVKEGDPMRLPEDEIAEIW
jgi:putative endopeptidase